VTLLSRRFPDGAAHVLGPVLGGGDHHFIFVSHPLLSPDDIFEDNDDPEPNHNQEVILEVLMSELCPATMSNFIRQPDQERKTAKETTRDFGLAALLPNMETDEVLFDPCGYSLNAINAIQEEAQYLEDPSEMKAEIPTYATVHITPESHCSFVSFETNMREREPIEDAPLKRARLVEQVIQLFRPGRFSVVASSFSTSASHAHFFKIPRVQGYSCKFKTHYEYEQGFQVTMMNFVKQDVLSRNASTDTLSAERLVARSPSPSLNLFRARSDPLFSPGESELSF